MSRGPGSLERAILDALSAQDGNALSVEDLCERCFPGLNRVEKKHRVSVIRSMGTVAKRNPRLMILRSRVRGGALIICWRDNLDSYAMARMKAEADNFYRAADTTLSSEEQERSYRSALSAPGNYWSKMVAPGGPWKLDVELATSTIAGDHVRASAIEHAKRVSADSWVHDMRLREKTTS